MGQALYRKYRSKSLDELVGQEHITRTLATSLKQGTISHAYLFTGPRGVGKTSVARILAHAINELPYADDSSHLDIIEIDAASNRRIDEIRDLRERIHIAPTSAKYKVYIIDEVHMLTREAFNALLKTLEEPPAHVVFILATTEAHKLPETIISRTQRFTFKPVEADKVVAHLRSLAKQENITIDDDALRLLAQHGGGSFRDSISLLDQVRSTSAKVGLAEVQTLLGIAPTDFIEALFNAIVEKKSNTIVTSIQTINEQGLEPAIVARQLGKRLREDVLAPHPKTPPKDTLKLLERLLNVPTSSDPATLLEIVLLDQVFIQGNTPITSPGPNPPSVPTAHTITPQISKKSIEAPKKTAPTRTITKTVTEPESEIMFQPQGPAVPLDDAIWQQALEKLKQTYNTLYGIARMTQTEFKPNEIVLQCKFSFHQKRLTEAKNKKILIDILQSLCGQPITLTCLHNPQAEASVQQRETVTTPPKESSNSAPSQSPEALSAISNIFGGGELLES